MIRSRKAGEHLGKSIIEAAKIMYTNSSDLFSANDRAIYFLKYLMCELATELHKREQIRTELGE